MIKETLYDERDIYCCDKRFVLQNHTLDELTDDKLVQLSTVLNRDQLRILAVNGLGLEGSRVQIQLDNDISTAVYNLLNEWRTSQTDMKNAYINLCEALEKVNMSFIINKLQWNHWTFQKLQIQKFCPDSKKCIAFFGILLSSTKCSKCNDICVEDPSKHKDKRRCIDVVVYSYLIYHVYNVKSFCMNLT